MLYIFISKKVSGEGLFNIFSVWPRVFQILWSVLFNLPYIPLDRDFDFLIDFVSCTLPISSPFNQMALAELGELKTKLQELLDMGYIHQMFHLGVL